MLDKNALTSAMLGVVQGGSFPENAPALSAAIASYVQAAGTPTGSTISFVLGPCTGVGWVALAADAASSGKGVGNTVISIALATEFASSTKVVPASHGTTVLPMSFNAGAKAGDLSNESDYVKVWGRISEAIIKFFEPEIR